jgi:hypothetical protein
MKILLSASVCLFLALLALGWLALGTMGSPAEAAPTLQTTD